MKIKFTSLTKKAGRFVGKHSHEILAGLGIAGFLAAIVDTAIVTPKALNDIRAAEEEKGEELTIIEKVKVGGKYYILPAGLVFASGGCIIGSVVRANRNIAAIATVCQLAQENLRDYKGSVSELLGEHKSENLEQLNAAKKVADKNVNDDDIVKTSYGDTLFYDPWSAHFFTGNHDRIAYAIENIKVSLASGEDYIPLNDFYDLIGLPRTQLGSCAGWTSRKAEHPSISYGYGPTGDGRSCGVLDYDIYLGGNVNKLPGTDRVLL